jgi:hypothetical protein
MTLVSISDLARLQSRDKALISRNVTALQKAGRIKAQPGRYGSKLIDLQEYEGATGKLIDARHFLGLSLVIELMAREGRLGEGDVMPRRLKAARYFVQLQGRADRGDEHAVVLVRALDGSLGVIDSCLVRSVLIVNKTITDLARAEPGVPVRFLTRRFCACLDIIAAHVQP